MSYYCTILSLARLVWITVADFVEIYDLQGQQTGKNYANNEITAVEGEKPFLMAVKSVFDPSTRWRDRGHAEPPVTRWARCLVRNIGWLSQSATATVRPVHISIIANDMSNKAFDSRPDAILMLGDTAGHAVRDSGNGYSTSTAGRW